MAKYRKKPVVVEATPWFKNGDHPLDYANDIQGLEGGVMRTFTAAECKAKAWEGQVVRYFRRPDVPGETACKHCSKTMHEHGWIDTLEGGHIVCPGDFVITGITGEKYPCKPNVFDLTYDPEPEVALVPVRCVIMDPEAKGDWWVLRACPEHKDMEKRPFKWGTPPHHPCLNCHYAPVPA